MFASINGIQMAFADEGRGLPLLFIHGFPLNRGAWAHQIEAFKSRFRVIVPDLRGFGESGSSAGPVSMSCFAEDIWALGQHLGLGPVILAGHSMGGYIALAIAKAYPTMLRGLVLVGTKAGSDSEDAAKEHLAVAQKVMGPGPSAVLEAMASKMLFDSNADTSKTASVRSCMAPANSEGIAGALRGMALRPDVHDVLGKIRVPTLIVSGSDDRVIPPSEAEALAKAIPDSRLSIIPRAGHLVALDQSEAFNEAMKEWLAWGSTGVHPGCQQKRQRRSPAIQVPFERRHCAL
ncbi:MAG: alpha/beta hydrolase [Holophagaceae bacterium]|uniref:Alpha/beta hydrolase n=1 Tax=Candidatus Geothrix skivensis TaxID=2954439 RepID=A0A9D7SJM2_9BACT|nr:alpha/beta hydrolase [Candidatus Geothrix skivensis]